MPPNYDVSRLRFSSGNQTYFSSSSSNTAQVYLRNATSTVGPFQIDGSNYFQNLISTQSITLDFTEIEICYDHAIPAFSGSLGIDYNGKFNSNNQVGDTFSVMASASSGQTSNTITNEIKECDFLLSGSLRSYLPGISPTGSLKVDRGDKATVILELGNYGTDILRSGELEVEIPSNFTYCGGSARFYYDTGISGAGTSTPDPDIGGTWAESNNMLSLMNFDLVNVCNNLNKRLFIEFDILTNEDAIAGPSSVRYNVGTSFSTLTNILSLIHI